jgi:pimeloyl-ACP methyl ester carboxylesterase
VLEHGHRANYLDWYLVQPQIAKFARVCSFDRAGHGWSDPSPKARIPSAMADELHSLLRAAGERPPYVLIGHSFGGWEAVMFAHKFPGEVAGVVLVDSPHPDALRPAPWRARLWLRTLQLTIPFGVPRWRGWCSSGPEEISAIKQTLNCRSQNFATILQEDAAFPASADEIKSITGLGNIPLVVVARDPASGRNAEAEARHNQEQRDSTKLSTNSRFVIAEGSGHDVPLARPGVVMDAVRNLIIPQAPAGSRGTP